MNDSAGNPRERISVMSRVLLVDDDDELIFLIGEYLEACGFDCDNAHSVAQARHCLKNSGYDLVVSDLHMPGESGLDLFRFVASRYPETGFVLMTGCLDSRIKREAFKMGISCYMEKPFQLSELAKIIRGCALDGSCTAMPASA